MSGLEHPYRQPHPQELRRPPKLSTLAVVAFVLACLFFVPFAPLIGGILGIAATVRVASRRDRLGGMGLAIAAIPVGFVCFLFLQGILAAVAVPAFIRYIRLSKASEAREALRTIGAGATAFYQNEQYDHRGTPLPKRFPAGRTRWIPAVPCCEQASAPACSGNRADWQADPWRALRFHVEGKHYYQYRYQSTGEGTSARFEAEARGDLDCDGRYSSHKLFGQADENGNVTTRNEINERLE